LVALLVSSSTGYHVVPKAAARLSVLAVPGAAIWVLLAVFSIALLR